MRANKFIYIYLLSLVQSISSSRTRRHCYILLLISWPLLVPLVTGRIHVRAEIDRFSFQSSPRSPRAVLLSEVALNRVEIDQACCSSRARLAPLLLCAAGK